MQLTINPTVTTEQAQQEEPPRQEAAPVRQEESPRHEDKPSSWTEYREVREECAINPTEQATSSS